MPGDCYFFLVYIFVIEKKRDTRGYVDVNESGPDCSMSKSLSNRWGTFLKKTYFEFLIRDTPTSSQVSKCDGIVLEIYLDHKFQWPQEGLSLKKIGHILKNKQKFKCVYIHEIRRLIIMKMKMKMKYRSHRYDINRPRSTHEHKFSKCKKCRTMMMLMCIKQHWGWVEKNRCL